MSRNFYYGPDASMVSGSAVFSAGINADPHAVGLTTEQALAYSEVDAALQAAYATAIDPCTRTPVAVSKKNAALKAMQRMAKNLADIIRATPTVSDGQLIALGLLPRPVRTRRHVPDSPPLVRVISVIGRIVTVRVCDRSLPNSRRKAFGASGAEIFSFVGEHPAAEGDFRYECFTSRTTAQITFPNDVPNGATVWLSARWVSARGETSIGSAPICFTLQGGMVTVAASRQLRLAA